MSYDSWITAEPDERGYCPYCWASTEDAERVCDDAIVCSQCGELVRDCEILSHEQMLREAREEARLWKADL